MFHIRFLLLWILSSLSFEVGCPSALISVPPTIADDPLNYTSASSSSSWLRSYFVRHAQRHPSRPCGRSTSCHQLSFLTTTLSSSPPAKQPDNFHKVDSGSPKTVSTESSPSVINLTL